jgi:integral membrane protein
VAPSLKGALRAYQTMAYIVGTALIVLVFVGIPLQFAAGRPAVVGVVGPIHGFLYIIYLVTGANLARRTRFTRRQLLAIVGAGLLPFLAFVIERRVRRVVTDQQDLSATNELITDP